MTSLGIPHRVPSRASRLRPALAALRRDPRPAAAAWWLVVLAASAVTGAVSFVSPQLGCTLVLAALGVGAYVRSRTAGLTVMWAVWLLAPLVRRVMSLGGGPSAGDPLALAPFLLTALLVAIEVGRHGFPRPLRPYLLAIAGGLALGLPTGLAAAPNAAAFALFAYLSAAGALVLGWAVPEARHVLLRALAAATPVLAVYGIVQYVALPRWDDVWLHDTGFITATAPGTDHVRVWSTLNSPGTFSMVAALALVAYFVGRRFGPARLLAIALTVAALALTYVRSAWLAVAVALLAVMWASRGRLAARAAVVLVIALIGVPAAVAGTQTGAALSARFDTLGALGTDTSAQARQATALALVPVAAQRPLGSGLGSAGEASRLAPSSPFRNTDNAYLSLLYQVGPLGLLLVAGAAFAGTRRAWRRARAPGSPREELAVFGMLVLTLAGMLTGDLLFGITAVAFWTLVGSALRAQRNETTTAASPSATSRRPPRTRGEVSPGRAPAV